MLRWLVGLLLLAAAAFGALYVVVGRGAPPAITIGKPDRFVGQQATLEVSVQGPPPSNLTIRLEQNGKQIPLFALDAPQTATTTPLPAGDGILVARPFGKQGVPELQQGSARIVVEAARPSWLELRTLSSSASKDFEIRLEPPRVSVVSTHHYVNHGGSELVLYRTMPADVGSGVRVGNLEYKGFPATGLGITGADPSLKAAFFALLPEQPRSSAIAVFARDEAGNESTAAFVNDVFPKPFRKSRIEVDDRFLERVVPEILAHSPELKLGPASAPSSAPSSAPAPGAAATGDPGAANDLLAGFLRINGELRRLNAQRISELVADTPPSRLWAGPFVQLGNSQVEAGFADQRTYLYQGKEVDQQVHLGFDLAVTSAVAVVSANAGKVVNASWLGIYGNCVVVDHGMGVASLYGHLSSIEVKVGDSVTKGQVLGKSGMTGLAGGDHLHFSMLVQGRPVNPVEWWDSHWIQDRVERKLLEAGGTPAAP